MAYETRIAVVIYTRMLVFNNIIAKEKNIF